MKFLCSNIIQIGRETSAIIVPDDYLCILGTKKSLQLSLILIFNELFMFKTYFGLMATLKDGKLYSGLEGHQPFDYAVTDPFVFSAVLSRVSALKISK